MLIFFSLYHWVNCVEIYIDDNNTVTKGLVCGTAYFYHLFTTVLLFRPLKRIYVTGRGQLLKIYESRNNSRLLGKKFLSPCQNKSSLILLLECTSYSLGTGRSKFSKKTFHISTDAPIVVHSPHTRTHMLAFNNIVN